MAERLYSDAPISAIRYDLLGRRAVAARLVELTMLAPALPLTIGLVGPAGSGKTSALHLAGELCAARDDLRAFALDAWAAGDAARLSEAFLREVARVFAEAKVVGQADKLRDQLFAVGDVVSTVARFVGVKVDVKGALERSPDELRDELMKLTEALGRRIVVFIDHLDWLPGAEVVAALRQLQRWGRFPYFAFVLAVDRDALVRRLREHDGDVDALERLVAVELPLPPVDRAALAAWVRAALRELAAALGVDGEPAAALFELDGGPGPGVVGNLRQAKRLLNALAASAPLAGAGLDLRRACLLELARQGAPEAYRIASARLPPLAGAPADDEARARLAAELARIAARQPRPEAWGPLLAALAAAP